MGYVNCARCKRDCVRADGSFRYTFCDDYFGASKTNGDYFQELSDEEKAQILAQVFYQVAQQSNAEHYILEWLKSRWREQMKRATIQSVVIEDNQLYINGEKLVDIPHNKMGTSVITQDGTHLCVNGYEWKRGKWRRTLRALWNYWF